MGKLPIPVTLGVIVVTIAVSVGWSLRSTRDSVPTDTHGAPDAAEPTGPSPTAAH